MSEQQSPTQPFEAMTMTEHEQQLRTIAIRVDQGVHAQLQFLAQLSGSSITEEIRRAIEHRLTTAQDDPDLIARAQQVRDEIEREAKARSAAIAGFMGSKATATTTSSTAKPRRPTKPSNE